MHKRPTQERKAPRTGKPTPRAGLVARETGVGEIRHGLGPRLVTYRPPVEIGVQLASRNAGQLFKVRAAKHRDVTPTLPVGQRCLRHAQ